MELHTVTETAKEKGCSTQAVRNAIKKDHLDAEVFGRTYVVMANKKYDRWNPNPNMQKGGKARAKKAKAKK